EGRMQTRSWEKDGQKQYRTEIIMDRFEFGPSTGGGSAPAGSAAPSTQKDGGAPVLPDYPEEEINPEDIPF
ncbi:MAG: single-stranded DNA-binding protein, partial [Candidatus Pacebacteria bacterium]|nr:single-stranded DNA-binding protein [Candidatus Paceibacterota bacterium]